MRVLIIADVHANLEALMAVANASGWNAKQIDQVWNVGDVVGYGPDPNEIVEFIENSDTPVITVLGNHDNAAISGKVENFNPYAAEAALWTSKALTRKNKEFLRRLPVKWKDEVEGYSIFIVHGSPVEPLNEYVHPLVPASQLNAYLSMAESRVLVMGHTHVPMKFELEKGIVVNPGSVGQSRDGIPSASYALMEISPSGAVVELHRQAYAISVSASKIKAVGLPDILAHRLFEGW